jgi:hypothetical protein
MSEEEKVEREVDLLRYEGNNVPRVLRFAWTLLIVFCVVYLARFMWPDLMTWLAK